MSSALREALVPIEESSTSIEAAFLQAGTSLARGLDTFGEIGSGLSSLLDDLNVGGMTQASAILENMSRELVAISRSLPKDLAVVQNLVAENVVIGKHLENLLKTIRMMTIIARSARIESVALAERGLSRFADEMNALIHSVQAEITDCTLEQAKLTDTMRQVAQAQSELDRDFCNNLLVLSDDLSRIFRLLEEQQSRGVGLIEDGAARSSRIAQAASMAMVSLQSGDTTRQRLENVASAIMTAITLDEGERPADVAVAEDDRKAVIATLARLQVAQLEDTVAAFGQDVDGIHRTLQALMADTDDFVQAGRATYGGQANGAESFLAVFRARLSTATEMLRTCGASRRSVEAATVELRHKLGELNETMSKLSATSLDVTMVGLNAGLKAVRLGPEGRSLMVIADELKRLAGEISREATALMGVFAEVQRNSHRLDRENDADGPSALDAAELEIAAILEAFEAADCKAAAFLHMLDQKAAAFDQELGRARAEFRKASAMNDALMIAADELARFAHRIGLDTVSATVAETVDALMQPKYTMTSERYIHSRIIAHTWNERAVSDRRGVSERLSGGRLFV